MNVEDQTLPAPPDGAPNAPQASDVFRTPEIVKPIMEYSNSVLSMSLLSRGIFRVLKKITVQFPWIFGIGRVAARLEAHTRLVTSLVVLEGGRLASGSGDLTIKVWELATGACLATLVGHERAVKSLAKVDGGWLAS